MRVRAERRNRENGEREGECGEKPEYAWVLGHAFTSFVGYVSSEGEVLR